MKIGVAIFGTGRMGSIHFRNCFLHDEIDIRWLVEEDLPKAEALLKKYGCEDKVKVAKTSELQNVLQDESVRFVIVSTPSFTHEPIVKSSLQAGKAVFCEKPISPSLEGTKLLYKEAKKQAVPLYCAFNRRFDPSQHKIEVAVHAGELGRLRSVRSVSRDPATMTNMDYIRVSGGIMVDSVIHNIDTIVSLAGGEAPCSVYATGHALEPDYAECGDVDTIVVILNFPSGLKGMIEVNRNAALNHDHRLEVFGERGMLQMNNFGETHTVLMTDKGALADPIHELGVVRHMDSYRLEMDHFVNVLNGKEEMVVTAESTILVNELVAACQKSLKSGQVVQFPQ